jgi:hypothetical protein
MTEVGSSRPLAQMSGPWRSALPTPRQRMVRAGCAWLALSVTERCWHIIWEAVRIQSSGRDVDRQSARCPRCPDALLASRRPMMLTMPEQASAHRWTITRELGHHGGANRQPLSPAQRIAVTIALINRGFDLLGAVVRTFLAGCTRRAVWSRHLPEPACHPLPVTVHPSSARRAAVRIIRNETSGPA